MACLNIDKATLGRNPKGEDGHHAALVGLTASAFRHARSPLAQSTVRCLVRVYLSVRDSRNSVVLQLLQCDLRVRKSS